MCSFLGMLYQDGIILSCGLQQSRASSFRGGLSLSPHHFADIVGWVLCETCMQTYMCLCKRHKALQALNVLPTDFVIENCGVSSYLYPAMYTHTMGDARCV